MSTLTPARAGSEGAAAPPNPPEGARIRQLLGQLPARARAGLRASRPEPGEWPCVGVFVAVLAIGAVLRFWNVGQQPGWQIDEPVYTSIGRSLLLKDQLADRIQVHQAWTPFLYHPPFYFLLLDGWFHAFGAGLTQARELSVVASLVMLALLFRLMWKLYDARLATVALVLIVLDGWLIFVERISYIENTLMILVVLTVILYRRALERPTLGRYLAAGVALGASVIFKHTGAYLLIAFLIHYWLTRRDRSLHRAMFGVCLLIIALYITSMVLIFDTGSHDWYVGQTMVQFARTFGLRASGGTLTSPIKAIELLEHQYAVFLPSLLIALASCAVMVVRIVRCVRTRSIAPLESETLLFSWAAGGIVSFGFISLHFPQYFALILVPMYCYLYQAVVRAVRTRREATAGAGGGLFRRRVLGGLMCFIVAVGIASATSRVFLRHDNVLLDIKYFAIHHVRPRATVITLESIGDEIQQPWCAETRMNACESARYVITWTTFLQGNPPHDPLFYAKLRTLHVLATFHGFNQTAKVYGP